MLDQKELLKKVLLAPVDFLTLAPFVIGSSLGLWTWAVEPKSGLFWFTSLCLVLASALVYIQRLALGWDKYTQRAVDETQAQEVQQREAKLDELCEKLKQDNDKRTDDLLEDLRVVTNDLAREINESSGWVRSMTLDIKRVVDQLFNGCVHYLEKSLELYRTAQLVRDREIKKVNLDEREKLIEEVRKSLRQLGDILANVRAINLKRVTNSQAVGSDSDGLENLRKELGLKLQAARDVENAVMSPTDTGIDMKKYIEKGKEIASQEGG